MYNNERKNEIKITLEKTNYFPGETMNVIVDIKSKDNINFNSLKISYTIKQIEYWENGNNIKENKSTLCGDFNNPKKDNFKDKNNYNENIVLSEEQTITNFNNFSNLLNNLKKNELSIALKINLPKDMRPSFEWNKDNDIFCFARTMLSMYIGELKSYTYNYLFIQKKCPMTINEINLQKTIGKEAFIFFWENDNIKFDIYSKKDALALYNNCQLQLKIDKSKLKSELISINLAFKRKIKFMIKGKQSVFDNTSDFTENLWEEKIDLNNKENNFDLKYEIQLVDNERVLRKKKLKFNHDLNISNKNYLTYLMPSYDGSNIKCEYFLKIKPVFEGNNIHVTEFPINFNLFQEENSLTKDAINEINRIFLEVNGQIVNENNSLDNTISNMNGGSNYSLPGEDTLKQYYSNKNNFSNI